MDATVVRFTTGLFDVANEPPNDINPIHGESLLLWLAEKLKGHVAVPVPQAEDWGWYIPVRNEGSRLAICCGHQDGDDDEFVCFTDPSTPIVKKFFKKIDATAPLTRLTEAMQQILSSGPEIKDVVWKGPT